MNCDRYPSTEWLRQIAAEAGAAACGVARVTAVSAEAQRQYADWIAAGRHAGMDYLTRYPDVRTDPELLLPGARTMIVCAFGYHTSEPLQISLALYARGRDYHEVVRERLSAMASRLTADYGGDTRVCVDTAPLRERYWATRAGLGFIGLNNQLIVPGIGSYVFIGTILWTGHADPTPAPAADCDRCGRCIAACPARALHSDGSGVDARRCLSYLTIEHRGPLPEGTDLCGHLYGCDECQRVCPHNAAATDTPIADFHPSAALRALTPAEVPELTPERFSAIFRHSAVRRTKLAGLLRNFAAIQAFNAI